MLLYITNIETKQEKTITPSRFCKRLFLKHIKVGNTGFTKQACFYSVNGNNIVFKDSKLCYSSDCPNGFYKIMLSSKCGTVELYSNQKRTRGISVLLELY